MFVTVSLMAMLLLQVFWIYNTVVLTSKQLKTQCDNVLMGALAAVGDASDFSLLSPLVSENMTRNDITGDFVLLEKDMEADTIVRLEPARVKPTLAVTKSDVQPFAPDGTRGVQLCFLDTLSVIFGKTWALLLTTLLTCIAIVAGTLEQIRIINEQRAMSDLKNDFSYALVHDMKSPLSSIIMSSRLLHSGKTDAKPHIRERYFDIIEDEAESLLRMVNQLLTISKLENKKLILNPSTVWLRPLVDSVAGKCRPLTDKLLTVDVDIQCETVTADEEYLREALFNLVENALKYSKETIHIAISAQRRDNHVLIKVRDNGVGIAADDQKRIFDKFERAEMFERNRADGVSGFGLGLNFVYLIMKAHGGKVTVSSEPDQYSEFTLYLPAKEEKNDKAIDS